MILKFLGLETVTHETYKTSNKISLGEMEFKRESAYELRSNKQCGKQNKKTHTPGSKS